MKETNNITEFIRLLYCAGYAEEVFENISSDELNSDEYQKIKDSRSKKYKTYRQSLKTLDENIITSSKLLSKELKKYNRSLKDLKINMKQLEEFESRLAFYVLSKMNFIINKKKVLIYAKKLGYTYMFLNNLLEKYLNESKEYFKKYVNDLEDDGYSLTHKLNY